MSQSRHVPFIAQREVSECGAACLAMVLGAYGQHRSIDEVRARCGSGRSGTTALAIASAARAFGLACKGVRLESADLADMALPAILHWEFSHFVVLERFTRSGAMIIDPAVGPLAVSNEQLNKSFTGVALVFESNDAFEQIARKLPSFGRYLAVFREFTTPMLQVLVSSTMLYLLTLILPIGTKILLDEVVVKRSAGVLWPVAAGLGIATLAALILRIARAWVIQSVDANADLVLTRDFLKHLIKLPLSYFLARPSGDIVDRMQSNTVVRGILGSRMLTSLSDVCMIIACAVLMIHYSPSLGITIIFLSACRVVLVVAVTVRTQPYLNAEIASGGRRMAALVEALATPETMRGVGAEERLLLRWYNRAVESVNNGVWRKNVDAAARAVSSLLQALGIVIILAVGMQQVHAGAMTLGTLAAFLTLQGMFVGPMESATTAISQTQILVTHLRRLDDVTASAPEQSGTLVVESLGGRVTFRNVHYAYEPDRTVLREIDLDIAPGETIGFIGRTGAGKSTLIRMIVGLITPTSGTVLIDNRDVRSLDLVSLRKRTGVVLQEAFLFQGSVFDNIRFGRHSVTINDVEAAAAAACLDSVVAMLPKGYDTDIGPAGVRLSGGERQRVCLARALVGRPSLLILDEATSALDTVTEQKIYDNLRTLRCTRIVIAHRLQTLSKADRIYLLDSGRVIQHGTYSDLITNIGSFRDLTVGPLGV